jgi:FMN phosphatase YigB (HAD superfamily)
MTYRDLLARVYAVLEARLQALEEQFGITAQIPVLQSNQEKHEGPSSTSTSNSPKELAAITFAGSIQDWPIFQDSSSALARLAKHFKLVVLSNIDNNSLGWTHKSLSLGSAQETEAVRDLYSYPIPNPHKFWHPQETPGSKSPFTAILTAQDVGCYKPSLDGFRTALDYIQSQPDLFGIPKTPGVDGSPQSEIKERVLCVAQSLKHDIEPANALGLQTVWIDRQSAVTCNEAGEGKPGWGKWTWRFETLGAMAEAVEKELV